MQALTVAALLRGVSTKQWRWFVFGGACLGLTGYTYLAARLFPLVLGIAMLPLLLTKTRQRWAQISVYLGTAFVVLLPLLVYFGQHPDAFWVRIGQVSAESTAQTNALLDSIIQSLGMYFIEGDPYWRFNIPGQSMLGIVIGILAVGGWIWLISRWRKWRIPTQRFAILLLTLTPLIMLLPTALAIGEIVPSNLRAIGVLPFIFYLPAVAVYELLHLLPVRQTGRVVATASLLVLAISTVFVARDYFREWATRSDVYYENDSDLVALAEFVDGLSAENPLYVAALHYRHPTVAFSAEQYDAIKWLPQSNALVVPPDGAATIVYPHSSPAPDWAQSLLANAERTDGPPGPDGDPLFVSYQLADGDITMPDLSAADSNFGNLLRLTGYQVGEGQAGGTLPVLLSWEVIGETERGVLPFVHIEDVNRYRWGQIEPFAYPAEQWQVGETIFQQVDVPLAAGMPTDNYRLHVGLFDTNSAEQIPVLDANGNFAGTTHQVEPVTVSASFTAVEDLPGPSVYLNADVQPGLRLIGFERGGETIATGEPFWLALWWEATRALDDNLSIQLYLTEAGGSRTQWMETQPVQGRFPFATWPTPAFVRDHVVPTVPLDTPSGSYTLELVVDDGSSIYTTDLGPLTIEQTERAFEPPAVEYGTDATFGNEIRLVGYDLAVGELMLVWQALGSISADYTVFVHVLNPDGTCCAWQQDTQPRQGSYPTSRWIENEIIADSYAITLPDDLPAGIYPVEVGLYLPTNGQRLSVNVPGLPDADFFYLQPLVIE
jgi:hypothetical protein